VRHGRAVTVVAVLMLGFAVLAEVGCDTLSLTTSDEVLRTSPSNLPQLSADQGARMSGYLDQYCEGSEDTGWINVQRGTLMGQKVTPQVGSKNDCGCNFLVGVEVGLVTGNPRRGGDTVTLFVIDFSGEVLAEVSEYIEEGFDGFYYFDLPGEGIRIAAGEPLLLRLNDTGKVVFGWEYESHDCYPNGSRYGAGNCGIPDFGGGLCRQGRDQLFRTYCDDPPEVYQLRELISQTDRLVTHQGIANSLLKKLENIRRTLETCDRKLVVARRALVAYVNDVEALPSSKIHPADAVTLIELARLILDVVEMSERPWSPSERRTPVSSGR
jgi:hypothetical protein